MASGSASAFSLLGPLLAAAGIGSFGVMLSTAIKNAQQENILLDTLMRRINDAGGDFDGFRSSISAATKGLGVTAQEATRLASTWARMSGEASPEAVTAGMRLGTGFGRAVGMDPEAATAALGHAQFLGEDPRRFALLIADAMNRGGLEGMPEAVTSALTKGLEGITSHLMTGPAIGAAIEQYQSQFVAMNAAGIPGLRGERATSILELMNSALSSGGGSMATQVFSMRALNAAGVTNPFEMEGLRQGGMFANVRGSTSVLGANIAELNREYGQADPFLYRHVAGQLFGLQQPQVAGLQKVFGNTLTGLASGGISPVMQRLQAAGVLGQLTTENAGDLAGIAAASGPGLETYRSQLLARTGTGALTPHEAELLKATAPGDLQDKLLQMYANRGMPETEASRQREAMVQLSNALTKLGEDLVPPVTHLVEGVTKVIDVINEAITAFEGPKLDKQKLADDQAAWSDTLDKLVPRRVDACGAAQAAAPGRVEHITDPEQRRRTQYIIDEAQKAGFSRNAALGLAEAGIAESGLKGNVFQWTDAPRVKSIEDHMRKKIVDASFEEQVQAHLWELTQGPEKAAGEALKIGSRTPYDAGFTDTVADERPAFATLRAVGRGFGAAGLDSQFPELPPAATTPAAPTTPGGDLGTIRTSDLTVTLKAPTAANSTRRSCRCSLSHRSPRTRRPPTRPRRCSNAPGRSPWLRRCQNPRCRHHGSSMAVCRLDHPHLFNPAISIVLTRLVNRTQTAAASYAAPFETIDITPYLGTAGQVVWQKDIGQPAGAFQVTFADHMHPSFSTRCMR